MINYKIAITSLEFNIRVLRWNGEKKCEMKERKGTIYRLDESVIYSLINARQYFLETAQDLKGLT